ncbi:rac GTPase-activating protein 1-like [Hetaerina americana]|uniref:rac GTPase-activating protein 1-like n=1 Tax=Hetaerina americana TaxID=62018 RepID=UPI003A7F5AB3
MHWLASIGECSKLKKALDESRKEVSSLESKLQCARKLLDLERKHVRAVNTEKLELERKFAVLLGSSASQRETNFDAETAMIPKLKWERNSRSFVDGGRMRTSDSLEMTDSWILDFSYSQSDDDISGETWKKMRPSLDCPSFKGRQSFGSSDRSHKIEMLSGDKLIQVTTGNGLPESTINKACATDQGIIKEEQMMGNPHNSQVPVSYLSASLLNVSDGSVGSKGKDPSVDGLHPPDIGLDFEVMKRMNSRQHCFVQRIVLKPEECNPCGKRINFCNMLIKCSDCKVLSHPECKENISLPCISSCSSPKVKKGSIADYVPVVSPMVPSLIIHCVREVESRGLSEAGIYQIPGSDKKIKTLKKKFLQGKGAPNLADYDIHVVCGVLKDFLSSLGEPLITNVLWGDFAKAAQVSDSSDSTAALYQAISELPKPNQDTLAYLILHLKKLSNR